MTDADLTSSTDSIDLIEQALIALFRRVNDPHGSRVIHDLAGIEIERAAAAMLNRMRELQPVRVSELAEASGVDLSAASRQVARLVKRGWVERLEDPADKRASLHVLSTEGEEVIQRLTDARRQWLAVLLADFSPAEQAMLGHLLDRFVRRMLET